MKEIASCVVCGEKKFSFLFKGSDRMHDVVGEYSLNQCDHCGLIFVNPQPEGEELSRHYPADDYVATRGGGRPNLEILLTATYASKGKWLKKFLLFPLKPKGRSLPVVPKGRLLDVGCGVGYFLETAKQIDMDGYGVLPGEFDRGLAEKNELKIFQGELIEAKYPNNYFDVITLNHVFEHIHNPAETLEELHRILKPDGSLIIAIPQSRNLAYWLFGKYWVSLDIPRHLFIYTTALLQQFAEHHRFAVTKIRYNSLPFQFLSSLLYATNRFRRKRKLLLEKSFKNSPILFVLFLSLAHLCNLFRVGDQVEVFLKKV